jgi:hypothetical protein
LENLILWLECGERKSSDRAGGTQRRNSNGWWKKGKVQGMKIPFVKGSINHSQQPDVTHNQKPSYHKAQASLPWLNPHKVPRPPKPFPIEKRARERERERQSKNE